MHCAICTRPSPADRTAAELPSNPLRDYQQHRGQPYSEEWFSATTAYVDFLSTQLGSGPQSLPPLQTLLAALDNPPPWWQPDHTNAVLGRYGQVIRAIFHDPDVSEDSVSDLLDNMEFRLIQRGLSARPVVWLRYEYVMLARGVRESEEWFDNWMELDPSSLCACRGCDPTRLLGWLVADNRLEAAARLTESFLEISGRMVCASQPQGLLAGGLDSLIQTRRLAAAQRSVSLGLRLAIRRPAHHTLVSFAHTLARCGHSDLALAIVRRATHHQPENRYHEALGMASVARVLLAAPESTPPQTFWPGFTGKPMDIADQLVTAAYNTAARFDRRHGSDVTTKNIRRLLAAEDLTPLILSGQTLLRRIVEPTSGVRGTEQTHPLVAGTHLGSGTDVPEVTSPLVKALHLQANPPTNCNPDELAALVRTACTTGTALEAEVLLDVWATHSTPESARTSAGVWLDCVRHCHDPDLDPLTTSAFLKRAAQNASAVGTSATQVFVKCFLLCDSDRWSVADTDYLTEQLTNTALLADDVLGPSVVAHIVGAASTLGEIAFLKAQKPVFSAALGRTPAGKQVYLQWNMLSRGKDPESCLEPMADVAAGSGHGADWLAVFCTRNSERCTQAGDWRAAATWLGRSLEHIPAMTCSQRVSEINNTALFLAESSQALATANPGAGHPSQGPLQRASMDDFLALIVEQHMVLSLPVTSQRSRDLLRLLTDFGVPLVAVEWAERLLETDQVVGANPVVGAEPVEGAVATPQVAGFGSGPSSSTSAGSLAGGQSAPVGGNQRSGAALQRSEVLALLAVATDQLGDTYSAAQHAQAAVDSSTKSAQVWHLAGTAALDGGDFVVAADRYATAAELSFGHGAMREVGHCVAAEAEAAFSGGGLEAGLAVVSRWESAFREPRPAVANFGAWSQLAVAMANYTLFSEAGDVGEALRCAQAGVGHAMVCDHPEVLLVARRRCLAALWAAGRTRETMSFAEEILGCYDSSSRHPALWDCAQAYATLAASLGEPGQAARVRQEYLGSVDVPSMNINVALSRDVAHRSWPES